MENKEEILEEIEDINEEQTTAKANDQIDNMLNEVMDNTSVINNVNTLNDTNNAGSANLTNNNVESINSDNNSLDSSIVQPNDLTTEDGYVEPKKSKTVIIIILSVLLIIDIIALIIYLIGLDKLGFIQ